MNRKVSLAVLSQGEVVTAQYKVQGMILFMALMG